MPQEPLGWYMTATIGIGLGQYVGRTAGEIRALGLTFADGRPVVPADVPDVAIMYFVGGRVEYSWTEVAWKVEL